MKLAKTIFAAALLSTLAVAGASHASTTRLQHALSCQPINGQAQQVGYGEPGIGNYSTTSSAGIFCPAPEVIINSSVPDLGKFTTLKVYATDNSAIASFSCYVHATNFGGATSWGPTRYTCSQIGGCPDPTTSYTGLAVLSYDLSSFYGYDSYGVACNVPAAAPYASWIAGITTLTQ